MELRKASYVSPGEKGKHGFEDLECFKLALDVVVNAHDFALTLPADEKYDMVSQIRRAAKRITANIAEGYGRYHYLDRSRFYSNARGSLNEVLGHLVNGASWVIVKTSILNRSRAVSNRVDGSLCRDVALQRLYRTVNRIGICCIL